MAEWSQSAFLQALGWATLNSFWQMALLWLVFVVIQQLFRLSSGQKYTAAVAGLGLGFAWFVYTFSVYYFKGTGGTLLGSQHSLAPSPYTWQIILSSASVAYLLLLVIPAYRLFKNWQYIEQLKKSGLQKARLDYRLFVKKVAQRLGIKKTVQVYLSHLVTSPVTIGYVKPMILLPVAALNGLSTQQVEAVLLHELSHIRRYDFLVNFIINLLHTLFYFNPFIRKFVLAVETEREKCCDELVLQFEYDKVSYASALLALEKNAAVPAVLAIGAAGKKHLLSRIEEIIGLEKEQRFSFNHFAGIMASLLLVIFLNSLFFVNQQSHKSAQIDLAALENPFYAVNYEEVVAVSKHQEAVLENEERMADNCCEKRKTEKNRATNEVLISEIAQEDAMAMEHVIPVAYDEADAMVNTKAKEQIKTTLDATKKVLTTSQWKEVEKSIADGMTASEKERARYEYMEEMEKINWKHLEQKMKYEFYNMDWNKITTNLNQALVGIHLDSLQMVYNNVLVQLKKEDGKADSDSNCAAVTLPVPDASVKEVMQIKEDLKHKLDSIKVIRTKKVVCL